MNRSTHILAAMLTALFLLVGVVGWQLGRRSTTPPPQASQIQSDRAAPAAPATHRERDRDGDDD